MLFSLICCTAGRTSELERLLVTLKDQSFRDFELILVDQNEDDRAQQILDRFPDLRCQRIRSMPGLARSLNAGITSARGEIVGFPDDDCRYDNPQLLKELNVFFHQHRDWDGITVSTRDDEGCLSIMRWSDAPGTITKQTVGMRGGCWTSIFLRREALTRIGPVDEEIGRAVSLVNPGSDIDYIYRAVALGIRVEYQPCLSITHPQTLPEGIVDANGLKKRYQYAYAEGSISRKHSAPLWYVGALVLFPFMRFCLKSIAFKRQLAEKERMTSYGRLKGWLEFQPAIPMPVTADKKKAA